MKARTHLPNEVSQRVPAVEDLPVSLHPGVSYPDLVPLQQFLVREAVRQVVAAQVSHPGAGYHFHGAPTRPYLHQWHAGDSSQANLYLNSSHYENVHFRTSAEHQSVSFLIGGPDILRDRC